MTDEQNLDDHAPEQHEVRGPSLVDSTILFKAEFAKRNLAPTNLSRLAADCGTVTSPLVPWNSCGAFMSEVLGVSTISYFPYAIFCFASPILSVAYGFTGFRIVKSEPMHSQVVN